MQRHVSHAIGFDDAPFAQAHRGDVLVVGAVCSGERLDGVLTAVVRRDGANATRVLGEMTNRSRFRQHLQLVMLQGIALAGFNVVDIHRLREMVGLPILVVSRRRPDLDAIRRALLERVPGGARKWKLIERAGPMEPMGGVHVQRAGLAWSDAQTTLARFSIHSAVPEPLRMAHLVAGGLARGESSHRV
jgi:endonuclease V-like protein UPF0215 family